jgi:SM-20-related protein
MLDFDRVSAAAVTSEPFPFAIIPAAVVESFRARVETDYPQIARSGSFPLAALSYGPSFAQLIEELTGARMREIVERKFRINLAERPVMVTVRGQCTARDGNIHADSATKLITMLFYTNRSWECANARLRILRSPTDIEDYAAEVPPEESTLVMFRNRPNAWHGFAPFHGQRRVIQVNWVTDASVVAREQARHRVSAFFKRLVSPGGKTHAAAH